MFNPRPAVHFVAIPGQAPCVVIDDALSAPQQWVMAAQERRAQFAYDPDNYYPGPELTLGPNTVQRIEEFFMQHVRKALGVRRSTKATARLSIATLAPQQLAPLQRLCHRDAADFGPGEGVAAMVLYLFEDAKLGGTSFYAPKGSLQETAQLMRDARDGKVDVAPAYMHASNTWFEQVCTVPAKFNRAIFYDGAIFHAAQIEQPELLTAQRLTMNAFIRNRRNTPPA